MKKPISAAAKEPAVAVAFILRNTSTDIESVSNPAKVAFPNKPTIPSSSIDSPDSAVDTVLCVFISAVCVESTNKNLPLSVELNDAPGFPC